LFLDLGKDDKRRESFVTAGGCFVLVQLLKNFLNKAIDELPSCDQVTELNELVELATLRKTLAVIINLTHQYAESRVGITVIGGVEAVVKLMKTFPKCQALQEGACASLMNLTSGSIGLAKAVESGGIKMLLAAVNNHLGSLYICKRSCWALNTIVNGSKENTELLITLDGGAAVARVRRKWPDNDKVQTQVRRLKK
jgi:hypothetical protein